MSGRCDKLGSTQVKLSYRCMTIRLPIAKRKHYPTLMLTVLHARESQKPVGRPRIDWKLMIDLPVENHDATLEKLQWYAMRWKIKIFHKILKSGCRAEQARLRIAERLVQLLAVFCILSWRVFWLTMLKRTKPDLEAALVLTECGDEHPRSLDPRSNGRSYSRRDALALSHQDRQAWRLPRAHQGSAARQHRHVVRDDRPDGDSAWRRVVLPTAPKPSHSSNDRGRCKHELEGKQEIE